MKQSKAIRPMATALLFYALLWVAPLHYAISGLHQHDPGTSQTHDQCVICRQITPFVGTAQTIAVVTEAPEQSFFIPLKLRAANHGYPLFKPKRGPPEARAVL